MKKEKGITLIALVITIIVLLILAGVAIAMLSGENGILRKAAESKTKTENAQKQEEARLTDMELTTYFVTNNLKYKCSNGYITGFQYYSNQNGNLVFNEVKETVEEFEKVLKPLGYKINLKYNMEEEKDVAIEESEKKELKIATGMSVQKDGKTVARTIVYGDTDGDGAIGSYDAIEITNYYEFRENDPFSLIKNDFQKIAADVNDDGEINDKDKKVVGYADVLEEPGIINQDRATKNVKNIKRIYSELQEYISLLSEETGYIFEYNNETDTYKLKGVKANTTVEELINALPNSSELSIYDENEEETTKDKIVKEGYRLQRKFKSKSSQAVEPIFATIEIEK